MPDSYFEDAEITISANETMKAKKYLRTQPYSGPVTITFLKGSPAAQLSTSKATASKGTLTAPIKYNAPAVAATEEFYQLQVSLGYKKVNKLLLTTAIWPKEINVTINDKNGKPRPACPFIIRQDGVDDQTLSTNDQGKCTAPLLARKPYTLHMAESYTVLEDKQQTPGQFRNHVLKVDAAIVAKFVTPDVSTAAYEEDADAAPARKQWVNLKSKNPEHAATGGCDAKGNVVVFTVSSDPPEKSRKDDKVYFEVTFGKESARNKPKTEVTSGIAVLGKKVADKVTTGYVIIDADGGKASFEVNLGVAGGDTCTVKIGGTPEVKDAELKLINWRKVYAQVTKSATMTVPALAPVTAAYKKVFVDFEESKADEVALAVDALPAGAMVDEAVVNGSGTNKVLVIGDHNVDWFENKLNARFATDSLPCVHLIYCDQQIDGDKTNVTGSATIAGKKGSKKRPRITYPGGGSVLGLVVGGTDASGDSSGYIYPKDLRDNSDSVKSCTWEEVGGTGATGDITSADYTVNFKSSVGNQLVIRLPAAAVLLSDGGSDILVKYEVAWAEGDNNGWCTDPRNANVIALGRPDADLCATIIHEIGHAIGQTTPKADKAAFPGLAPPHPRWYDWGRGHSGNHCANGLDDTYYNKKSNKINTTYASDLCTCVMYGSTASRKTKLLDYCAHCAPFVNAADIKSIST